MPSRVLASVLQELGNTAFISLSTLHPDANNSCIIELPIGFKIQLELDSQEKNLIVGAALGTIAESRYRHNFFREALKANGLPQPRYGTFAYSTKTNHFILHDFLNIQDLNGEKLATYLEKFVQKALLWKQAIDSGDVPQVATAYLPKTDKLFGFK